MRIVLRFLAISFGLSCTVLAAATLLSSSAVAIGAKPAAAPKNLRAFLLTPTEPITQVFPRTPAFSWSPVKGATCYEFELATSSGFGENSVVWSNVRYGIKPGVGCASVPATQVATTDSSATATPAATDSGASAATTTTATPTPTADTDAAVTSVIAPLRVPAVSVDVALPWFTGQPYALYAHARAITAAGPTGWSKSFAFNMRWPSVPTPLPTQPGLVRWSSVSGATGYQVWYTDIQKSFSTHTNVADLREFYTLKNYYSSAHWRVRAVRRVFGDIPNGLPAVSYGPWSPVYTAANPTPTSAPLTARMALSDGISDGAKQSAHSLMPGLVFNGDLGLDGTAHLVNGFPLFRAYISTDRDCVNTVFRGSVVGSPAYAPRTTGPLALPNTLDAIASEIARPGVLPDVQVFAGGSQPAGEWGTDWRRLTGSTSPNEMPLASAAPTTTSSSVAGSPDADQSSTILGTRVDLPDIDFPTTRYYWTVVPVVWAVNPSDPTQLGWYDVETPQDACAAGRVESFGKESAPVLTGTAQGDPYVAGLKPDGRLLSSAGATRQPTVYSTPLIAWEPALAATAYEVQWSRTLYPWRAQGTKTTYSTSAVLDLAAGKWFYRVRGLNQTQLKKVAMSWSTKVAITVAKPKFKVIANTAKAAKSKAKTKQTAAKKK